MIDAREPRREQLRTELTARLERLRGRMTDAAFGELMAAVDRTAESLAELDAGPGVVAPSDRAT